MAVAILDESWIEIIPHDAAEVRFKTEEFECFIYDMDCRLAKLVVSEKMDTDNLSEDDRDFLDGRTGFRPVVLKLKFPADLNRAGGDVRIHYSMGAALFTFRANGVSKTFSRTGDPIVMGCPFSAVQNYKHKDLIDLKADLNYFQTRDDCMKEVFPGE